MVILMAQTVRRRDLKPGNHIIEAYDENDRLLLRNYWVHNEKDLKRLKELNVYRATISESSLNNTETKKKPYKKKTLPRVKESETRIKKTQVLYRNTIEEIKHIFRDVKENIPVEPDGLLPFINNMIDYASASPASIAFLTQIEEYDFDTFRHSVNVGILTILYCRYHNFSREKLLGLAYGAMLHDIGKIFIAEDIITKRDRLSDEEYKIVKKHPEWGYEALKKMDVNPLLPRIAYEHHERPDGSGYPEGKTKIADASRIISVFDVYDALVSKRVYKERITPNRAFLSLTKEFGCFPETKKIVQDLLRCIGLYPVGSIVRLTNEEIGVVHRNHPGAPKYPEVCIIFDEDEQEVKQPYLVDLQQTQAHKLLHSDHFYDSDVEIKEVISIDHINEIADDNIFSTFDRLERQSHKEL
jgi:putative nucleotidyltransferase with HDIG domain